MRSVSRLRLTVLVAGSMFAACLAPAGAQAGWSASQPVVGTGPDTSNTRIAGNPDSLPLVVWTRPVLGLNVVQATHLNEDGTSGPVLNLSSVGQNAESPVVSMAPNGTAAVAWVSTTGINDVVQSVTVTSSNEVSAVGDRSAVGPVGQDAAAPRVAIQNDGTMAVAWRKFNGSVWTVEARVVSSSGVAAAIQSFPALYFQNTDFPDVAAQPSGGFRLVWAEGTGALGNVATQVLNADGTVSPAPIAYAFPTTALNEMGVEEPAGATGDPADARIVVFNSGLTVFGWLRSIPTDPEVPASAVRSVEGSGIDNLEQIPTPTRISSASFPVSQFSMNRSTTSTGSDSTLVGGNAAIGAWTTEVAGNRRVQAVRMIPGGTLGSPAFVSGNVGTEGFPEGALSLQNWSTVAWTESTPTPGVTAVKAGRVSPTGQPTLVAQDLGSGFDSADGPQIAMGPQGIPTVGFDAVDGANLISAFSRFTDPGLPTISPSKIGFSSQLVNIKSKSRLAFLVSTGSTDNQIQDIALTGTNPSQFTLAGGSTCFPSLGAGDVCSVGVNFKPTSKGGKSAKLTVQTEGGPVSVNLSGQGSARTRLKFSVKPKNRAQRRGRKGKITASVKNTGGIKATGVKICAYGNKRVVRPKKRCVKVGSVAVNKTVKRTFKLRLNGRAKKGKKYVTNFKMTVGNANNRRASVRLRLKR